MSNGKQESFLSKIIVPVVVTLLVGGTSPWWWEKVFPNPTPSSEPQIYRVGWDYTGVDRCGSDQENVKEARIAAEQELSKFGQGATLVDFKIVDQSTRRWEEKDSFGFYKGRKCATHLEIDVKIRS